MDIVLSQLWTRLKNRIFETRDTMAEVLGEEGMGVVEVILIIVVLIGLVIIFQTNIKNVVASIFKTIETNAGKVK